MIDRQKIINVCFAVLERRPLKARLDAIAVLREMGFTGDCEACRRPSAPVCRWCPTCLKLHSPAEEHDTLGLLIPRDE